MIMVKADIIEYLEELSKDYRVFIHRTKNESNAKSILEKGLYFVDNLLKVTQEIGKDIVRELEANRLFLRNYGEYQVIVAIKKIEGYNINDRIEQANGHELKMMLDVLDLEDVNQEDIYHLPAPFIKAYFKNDELVTK